LDVTIIRAWTAGLIEEEQLFGKKPGAPGTVFIIMNKPPRWVHATSKIR
jgi:hypothetical protein